MHTPIFVQWILGHNQPADPTHLSATCIMCAYKSLAWDYWLWQGQGGQKIIAANHAGLTSIDTQAILAQPLVYAHSRPGDAGIFFEWVTDQMEYAIPAVVPADQRFKLHWNEEFKAMFQLDLSETRECQEGTRQGVICGKKIVTPAAPVRSIEVDLDPEIHTLDEMLDVYFNDYMDEDRLCTRCNVNRRHTVKRTIRAVPQVLRIRVNIMDEAADGMTTKYLNGWTVPTNLNLQGNQEIDELPLEYALSSSIAHGEDRPGLYEEVGGVTVRLPVGDDDLDDAPVDLEPSSEREDEPMAVDEDFDPNDPHEDLFDVPERVDSVMAEDEPHPVISSSSEEEEHDEDDIAEPLRDCGIPHLVPRHVVAGGVAPRSPVRDEDDDFNGLILVTNEEFLEELGPSVDMEMDDLPEYTDTEGEDDDEDEHEYEFEAPEQLNRREGSASPPQDDSDDGSDSGVIDDLIVDDANDVNDYIDDEEVIDVPHRLHDDMYGSDEESVIPNSHYILNVRGPEENYHISMAHHNHLDPHALPLATLSDNPQRPWHMPCHNPRGYQVVTLTYTRKPLESKWKKMEQNIPAFI
ncbi:hypothetical protein HBI12_024920 [Parastagonospora nodorum]|nr:hypothetical protein HBI12_024920 [Parastagonospora nodorum]